MRPGKKDVNILVHTCILSISTIILIYTVSFRGQIITHKGNGNELLIAGEKDLVKSVKESYGESVCHCRTLTGRLSKVLIVVPDDGGGYPV